jgi:Tol biopolymer transport system component
MDLSKAHALTSRSSRAALILIFMLIFSTLPSSAGLANSLLPPGSHSRRCFPVLESRWVNGYYLYSYAPRDDRFAFVMETGGNTDIWTARRDGSRLQRLTTDPGQDILPSWSPDGRTLAFISSRGGTWNLWTMEGDGSRPRKLLAVDKITPLVTEPVWSPDGARILTISFKGGCWDLWRVNADGKDPIQMTHNDRNELAFSWIERGRKILFASTDQGRSHICTIDVDGADERRLTPDNAICLLPNINQEGTRIAYVNGGAMNSAICTMDGNGEDAKTLTASTWLNTLPKWSPDGRRLAFISNRGGSQEIWSMDASGLDTLQCTSKCGNPFGLRWLRKDLLAFVSYRNDLFTINLLDPFICKTSTFVDTSFPLFQPCWAPDCSKVITTSFNGHRREILRVNLQNHNSEALFAYSGEEQSFPACNSRTGQIAFSGSENDGESQIWIGDPEKGESRRITNAQGIHILPSWSPDGERLAFYSNENGRWNLSVAESNGITTRHLAPVEAIDENKHTPPAWSHEGRYLLVCGEKAGNCMLARIDAEKGESKTLLSAPCIVNPLFSRDSRHIYYFLIAGDREEIWMLEVSSLRSRRLTNSRITDICPMMTIGRERIVFTRNGDIWTMDLEGAMKEQIISLEGEKTLPLLSPDEESLLFTALKGNNRDLCLYRFKK